MSSPSLSNLAVLFLKLGLTAFGGPAAHIAMMEEEVVRRRGWLDRQRFLDLIGATNLIPGPNSTEMAIHVGYILRGWSGLIACGVCFIFPAALLTLALAWIYVQYGVIPQAVDLLQGVKPAIIVILIGALFSLGKKAVKSADLAILAVIVAALAMIGVGPVKLILGAGLGGMLWLRLRSRLSAAAVLLLPLLFSRTVLGSRQLDQAEVALTDLGLYFLKIGSVLFGSGYVLIAYLEEGMVRNHGWITQAQLLDAIAIGQLTPGPVLTTATFLGYLTGGFAGASVATGAIFLPSFIFVLLLNPLLPKLRSNPWPAAFLDSVNAAAVALMAAVTIELAGAIFLDWRDWAVLAVAAALAFRLKLPGHWMVPLCGLAGWLLRQL